ncbi:MAG: fumarate hydratase [Spirochaetaceae bacterium]|jgi:fumarate hydratase subunit alpha|nr:fumarate hydratase [Spirochaetaceae bacterium]
MPRIIDTCELIPVISHLIIDACNNLNDDQICALQNALQNEESPYGRAALDIIIKNAAIAKTEQIPCCQDTGTCVVFMEIGQEISWKGEPLASAVNEAVARGYTDGFLRKSMVRDPLERINTGDNTPAVLHTEIVSGDKLSITVLAKGGGSENMNAFTTLLPSGGEEAIRDFVVQTVEAAGGKPCPPLILGIGLGGTMERCALLAKKALLRAVGERNTNPRYAQLEEKLLRTINNLGIGPLGMGGRMTVLDVHIDAYPCHVTALPVALNFQCHAARHKSITL